MRAAVSPKAVTVPSPRRHPTSLIGCHGRARRSPRMARDGPQKQKSPAILAGLFCFWCLLSHHSFDRLPKSDKWMRSSRLLRLWLRLESRRSRIRAGRVADRFVRSGIGSSRIVGDSGLARLAARGQPSRGEKSESDARKTLSWHESHSEYGLARRQNHSRHQRRSEVYQSPVISTSTLRHRRRYLGRCRACQRSSRSMPAG